MISPRIFLAVTTLILSACGSGDGAPEGPPQAVVRDSAGVAIVENPPLESIPRLGWSLSTEPAVDIGALDGPEAYQLFRVRGALRLEDGRIVVANGGTGEIRSYDAQGRHLASWGQQGEGPGEFLRMTAMDAWPMGDSIAVWDSGLRRLTILGSDGSLGRTLTFSPTEAIQTPTFVTTLPGGRIVVTGVDFEAATQGGGGRLPTTYAVVDAEGGPLAQVGTFPGRETLFQVSGERINIISIPFARTTVPGRAGDAVVIADNQRFELPVYSADGGAERIVRVASPPPPVTEALRLAEIDRRVSLAPEQAQPGMRVSLEEVEMPGTLPLFQEIHTDALGNLWVELYGLPTETGPTEWLVLDAEGRWLGRMETPEGMRVHQIGADFVLGAWEDDLDVEHVQLWTLTR